MFLFLLHTAEGDDVDLGPSAEAEGDGAANAQRHMEVAAVFGIHAAPFVVRPPGGREAADLELPCMGVAAEGELDVGGLKHAHAPMGGVVAEQNLEHAVGQILDRLAQVAVTFEGGLADVLHTDKGYLAAATLKEHVLVHEHVPSHLLFHIDEGVLIALHALQGMVVAILAVVMVAHHGIDAVRGMDVVEHGHEGEQLCGTHVDQIACEHHKVWLLGVDHIDQFADERGVLQEGADMDVGELQHAVAVESLGNGGIRTDGVLDHNPAPAKEETVEQEQLHHRHCRQSHLPPYQQMEQDEESLGQHETEHQGEECPHARVVVPSPVGTEKGGERGCRGQPPQYLDCPWARSGDARGIDADIGHDERHKE